ncbi:MULTISPECIES: hypothetical protein [unclassified Microbulbifer]|uniref:hypothetical protein n=1 Tax=unclassified Microbulbifer TaxID=2619833 RepID=UPI0027E4C48F|nr:MULTISPECIES: hypothetical protein [unclassified Microbulbifer]
MDAGDRLFQQLLADHGAAISRVAGAFSGMSLVQAQVFTLLFVAVWFHPTIVALFCNRKHLGKILLANVPAGLSWVAVGLAGDGGNAEQKRGGNSGESVYLKKTFTGAAPSSS